MIFLKKSITAALFFLLIPILYTECYCQLEIKKNPCPIDADIWCCRQSQMAAQAYTRYFEIQNNVLTWMIRDVA